MMTLESGAQQPESINVNEIFDAFLDGRFDDQLLEMWSAFDEQRYDDLRQMQIDIALQLFEEAYGFEIEQARFMVERKLIHSQQIAYMYWERILSQMLALEDAEFEQRFNCEKPQPEEPVETDLWGERISDSPSQYEHPAPGLYADGRPHHLRYRVVHAIPGATNQAPSLTIRQTHTPLPQRPTSRLRHVGRPDSGQFALEVPFQNIDE